MVKQHFSACATFLIALSLLLTLFQPAIATAAIAARRGEAQLLRRQQVPSSLQSTVPDYAPVGVEYPATGAFRAHFFDWAGEKYSVVSYWRAALTWNIASPVSRRQADGSWLLVNNIPTSGARECTPFVREIDGEDRLVFVCAEEFDGNVRNIVSRVWLWHGEGEDQPLECIQEIATVGAYGATVWESDGQLWAFIPHYLGPTGYTQNSQLLVWDDDWSPGSGEPFSQVMTLETDGAKYAAHTVLGGIEFLFVCQSDQDGPGPQPPDSALYLFQAGQAQPLIFNQTVATIGCASATWFDSDGVHYLAIANQGGTTGYEQYSAIFYFGEGGTLVEAVSVLTYGAAHWTFESRTDDDYLTIANFRTLTGYDPISRQYRICPGECEEQDLNPQVHFLGDQSLDDYVRERLARGLDLPAVIHHGAPGSQPITLVPIADFEASGGVQFARQPDFNEQPRMLAVRHYNEDDGVAASAASCLLTEEDIPPIGRYRTDLSLTPDEISALWTEDVAEIMTWPKRCAYEVFADAEGGDDPAVQNWNVPMMQYNDRSVSAETHSNAPTPSGGATEPHTQSQSQSPPLHTPTRSQSQSQSQSPTPRGDDSSAGGGGGGGDDALAIGLGVAVGVVVLAGGGWWWKYRAGSANSGTGYDQL